MRYRLPSSRPPETLRRQRDIRAHLALVGLVRQGESRKMVDRGTTDRGAGRWVIFYRFGSPRQRRGAPTRGDMGNDIVIGRAGSGGDGIVSAGDAMITAAALEGFHAVVTKSFGPQIQIGRAH